MSWLPNHWQKYGQAAGIKINSPVFMKVGNVLNCLEPHNSAGEPHGGGQRAFDVPWVFVQLRGAGCSFIKPHTGRLWAGQRAALSASWDRVLSLLSRFPPIIRLEFVTLLADPTGAALPDAFTLSGLYLTLIAGAFGRRTALYCSRQPDFHRPLKRFPISADTGLFYPVLC